MDQPKRRFFDFSRLKKILPGIRKRSKISSQLSEPNHVSLAQSGSPESPLSISFLPAQPPDAPAVRSRSDHSLPQTGKLSQSEPLSSPSGPGLSRPTSAQLPNAPVVLSRSDHSLPQTSDLPQAEPLSPPLGPGLSRSSSAPPETLMPNLVASVDPEISRSLLFQNDEDGLWKEAFEAYSKDHKNWREVHRVLSAEPSQIGIRVAVKKFEKYRKRHERFYRGMEIAMKGGETAIAILGDTVKGTFPPASILFGISTVFFDACKGVSDAHDTIDKMLEDLDFFMTRLTIHQETMTAPLRNTLAKSLKIMLEVIGFITSAANEKEWTRVKLFLKGAEWKEKHAALERFANFEGLIVMAETRKWVMQTDSTNDVSPKDTENAAQEKRRKALSPRADCSTQFFHGIKGSIVRNTGSWIENTTEFKDWQKGTTPVLLVSGPTGFGKTYLCANIINRLLSKGDEDEQNLLVSFFGRQGLELTDVLRTWAFDLSLKDRAYQKHVEGVLKGQDDMKKLKSTADLWKRLFLDFHTQKRSNPKEDLKPIYLVLDGLDTTNTNHTNIDTFLSLMKDYQNSAKAPQSPIFRILIMCRLDQVDFKVYEGLNHHEITKKDLEDDICQYIKFHLSDLENKEQHAQRLSRMAENFAWTSIIIGVIQRNPSGKNIEQIIREPPKTDFGLIESIADRIETASRDVCKVLNTLLMWLIYSKKAITLEDLDCIFKIEDRYRQGVPDLEGTVKTYPSLFRLIAADGPAADGPATETDQTKPDMLPFSRKEILSTKLKKDRRQMAHFRNVTIEFSQQSIKDYFRNHSRSGHNIRVDRHLAHFEIARFCMVLFCEDSLYQKWHSCDILHYARRNFHFHVAEAIVDQPSEETRQEMSKLLTLMFHDEDALKRWALGTGSENLHEWLLDEGYMQRICTWLSEVQSNKGFSTNISKEATLMEGNKLPEFQLLEPLTKVLASQWLDDLSETAALRYYEFLDSYMQKVSPSTNTEATHDHATGVPEGEKVRLRAAQIARYFGIKHSAKYHLRVAQVLRNRRHWGTCKDEYHKALKEDPDLHLASYNLAQVLAKQWDFSTARELFRRCLDGMMENNSTTSTHILEAATAFARQFRDDDTMEILKKVIDHTRAYQDIDEDAQYACFKSLLTYLVYISDHEALCTYLQRFLEERMPTGESKLSKYLLKDPHRPLILDLLPENSAYSMKGQSNQLIPILRHCLEEAKLVCDQTFIPIFQDYLASFLFQNPGGEREAIELWTQALKWESGNLNTSVTHRAKANATRHLSSIYFTRALVAQTMHAFDQAKEHVKELVKSVEFGVDPEQRTWWFAHCSSLMLSAWHLRANSVNTAHEHFKSNISDAVILLEDQWEFNDIDGFLILAETLMTTGVDDEDASAAISLFLQYRCCWVACDACGGRCSWQTFQVCRFCKVDLCDKCHTAMQEEQLIFRLCHPLHDYFKPTGDDPEDLVQGYVILKNQEVHFTEWLRRIKSRWEVPSTEQSYNTPARLIRGLP